MERTIMTIGELMTPEPCAVDEGLTLADAADRMTANNVRHLLVLRGNRLVGTVDLGDVVFASEARGDHAPVSIATRRADTCRPEDPISEVVRQMEGSHRRSAVVVSGNHVVGIFTVTDALRALRQLSAGEPVRPEVVPTHAPELPAEREQVLPSVRVKRLLREHRAAPSPNDGKLFGATF